MTPNTTERLVRACVTGAAALTATCAITTPALGAPPPDFGLSWKTIGDPGNRPASAKEAPDFYEVPGLEIIAGQVDYTYRMTTTEVTVSQWFEFVEAYLPYYEGTNFSDPAFGGNHILFSLVGGKVVGAGIESPFWNDTPANMSWEYAARYVNWLHNGKGTGQASFESGVYDTSTFVQDKNGNWLHQAERSPGAKFWIPSLDEWTKAAYWDPEKNDGEGGYWQYPNGSDSPLIPGKPEDGGETNAGPEVGQPYDVGSYPDTLSPWGLMDMSGGMREWLEDPGGTMNVRLRKGSRRGGALSWDSIDHLSGNFVNSFGSFDGLRLAGAIPTPSTFAPFAVLTLPLLARQRRRPA